MPYSCDQKELLAWAERAALEDITYHRTRVSLWDSFTKIIKAGGAYRLDDPLFNSIKSALTCRSSALDDNKRLAFDTALQQLSSAAPP